MLNNDKTQVIIAVTLLSIVALLVLGAGAKELLNTAIGGLLGFVTGATLSGGKKVENDTRNVTKNDA